MPELRRRVAHLRQGEFGADQIYRISQKLLRRDDSIPDLIVAELKKLVRNRNGRFTRARLASDDEIEQLETAAGDNKRLPRPYYIDETVGIVDGLAALYQENDLRSLLVIGITNSLDDLENQNISAMRSSELAVLNRRTSNIDAQFTHAETAVNEGKKLLRKSNLEIFRVLLIELKDKQKFAQLLSSLPD